MGFSGPTIYWHDYETFGVSPSTDRPSQFAGVRTTLDLEVVGDPLMIYCQPVPDMLPAPDACLVTGITPQYALREGIPEPEFIAQIQAELSRPQTCGAGYNSLRFDDEVTRYTLYRNFYDPYAREWQNGNSRWDIIDMVRLVYALRPESMAWPEREPGIASFKLELLSQINGLQHEAAHDALSDVDATIRLARHIKSREPRLYEYCWSLRNKRQVASKIDLRTKKPLLHISSKIQASRGCTTIVMPLCMHPKNKNAVICIDLQLDEKPLFELNGEQIRKRLYTAVNQLEEGEERIPLKAIHMNRCPIVLPVQMLDPENAKRLQIDVRLAEVRWQRYLDDIRRPGHGNLIEKAKFAFAGEFEGGPAGGDSDSALYQGFVPDADRRLADLVLEASPQELAGQSFQFRDERMTQLLFRYRARHFPDGLNEREQALWLEDVRERYMAANGQPSRLDHYEADLARRIEEESNGERRAILENLQDWAKQFRSKFG